MIAGDLEYSIARACSPAAAKCRARTPATSSSRPPGRLDGGSCSGVPPAALPPQQALVGGLLDQGMAEAEPGFGTTGHLLHQPS